MSVLDMMEMSKAQFTKTDWAVYNVISEDWVRVFRNSSNGLAKTYGLSQASVVRFCKRLGYEGYTDFRLALYNAVQNAEERESTTLKPSKAECLKRLIDSVDRLDREGKFDNLIDVLVKARIVYTAGVHRSSLPARLLMYEMRLHNQPAAFLPQDQMGNYPHGADDVIVVFSEAGDMLRNGMEELSAMNEDFRPTTVLVCMDRRHPLRKYFDRVICLPSSSNQGLPARVDPSLVFSFFVDLLSAHISEVISRDQHA